MKENQKSVTIKASNTIGFVIRSLESSVVYIIALRKHDGSWMIPRFSFENDFSKKEDSIQKINELLSLHVTEGNFIKKLGKYPIKLNETDTHSVLYHLIEVSHTPVSLTNKDEYKEVKWVTLEELKKLDIVDGSLSAIEQGVSFMRSRSFPIKSILISLSVVILFSVSLYGIFYTTVTLPEEKKVENIKLHKDAYLESILQNNPVLIQNSFLSDIKSGVNDKFTKSDAYFVTHRFFDNGGNIYELYDYVNSHPELAFLKEAESMYPDIFDQIKRKVVPAAPVDRAYYAYLAYVEVLYNHGYTDVAALGTAANQYAKIAYFNSTLAKEVDLESAKLLNRYIARDTQKALQFIALANPEIAKILNGKVTSEDVTERDILVGLNQYGASLRYLKAMGVDATSTKTANQVFEFTMPYAYKNVPELRHFTALLNASTLVIFASSSPSEVEHALYPILDLDVSKVKLKKSIIFKIIDSRFKKDPVNKADTDLDIYSKRNVKMLANKVPLFKEWLTKNGWQESDFK